MICTWYDHVSSENENKTSTVRNFMLHFSARRSYNKITQINYTRTGLDSIYFIRFIACLNIIVMHNLLQYIFNPTINAIEVENVCKTIKYLKYDVYEDIWAKIFFILMFIYRRTKFLSPQ